jgi:hypothetical protein
MERKRIQVYADREPKRRIELATAQHDVGETDYCLEAIKQQLPEDDFLETETVEIPVKPVRDPRGFVEVRALHEEIKAHRRGKLIGVDQMMDQVREEREHELNGLGISRHYPKRV